VHCNDHGSREDGGALAPIVSMILTSAKQVVEQQLQR
jgi:hypothetical protein